MKGVVLTAMAAFAWLALLVATNFNGVVLGAGLLLALGVSDGRTRDRIYGRRHGH